VTDATVIGARGFIGAQLAGRLEAAGMAVAAVGRGDPMPARPGHVYFCAGLTADFRARLHDTVEAHVTLISKILQRDDFESLTYLSSTRVYQRARSGDEDALLTVDPREPSDLYNLSKLTGEALCLADPREGVRVVRLSNVVGAADPSANFLNAVLREARQEGEVLMLAGAKAAKDYIALEDAVEAIHRMPLRACSRLVNVAAGRRVSNAEVAQLLQTLLGVTTRFATPANEIVFPAVANRRMREELGVEPEPFESLFARFAGSPP
jgi:nucleoside-diphosphate-sugar epimerase